MKELYMFTASIPNYYNDGKFEKQMLISSDHCPTKEEIIQICTKQEQKNQELEDEGIAANFHEYQEVINSINECQKFPFLYSNLIETSHPFKSERLKGDDGAYLCMQRVSPFEL